MREEEDEEHNPTFARGKPLVKMQLTISLTMVATAWTRATSRTHSSRRLILILIRLKQLQSSLLMEESGRPHSSTTCSAPRRFDPGSGKRSSLLSSQRH